MSQDIIPFRIDIPEDDLEDLRERLRRTRWPEPETVDDWSQGTPLSYARELCEYWQERYDWRASEVRLNRFPQFRTEIDGLDIHVVHLRSPHGGAVPLIMTHGWPGSIVEFHKVIEPLADPRRSAATPKMPSTWYALRCPATGSAASPPGPGGGRSARPGLTATRRRYGSPVRGAAQT